MPCEISMSRETSGAFNGSFHGGRPSILLGWGWEGKDLVLSYNAAAHSALRGAPSPVDFQAADDGLFPVTIDQCPLHFMIPSRCQHPQATLFFTNMAAN